MTQFNAPRRPTSDKPNVYTALAFIATCALIAGVVYMFQVNTAMTGEGNPFVIKEKFEPPASSE